MPYIFKYNRITGTYEMSRVDNIIKECIIKNETSEYIDDDYNRKIVGFGDWLPKFMLIKV